MISQIFCLSSDFQELFVKILRRKNFAGKSFAIYLNSFRSHLSHQI